MPTKTPSNSKKIRLVGGPFGGKTLNEPSLYGRNEIVYRGQKRMTREQKYNWMRNNHTSLYQQTDNMLSATSPIVEARYELAMGYFGSHTGNMVHAPMRHPDGSLFYTYVKGSKREW